MKEYNFKQTIQKLTDEVKSIIRKKQTYTDEEIDQIIQDFKNTNEQFIKLKEVKDNGTIPEDDAELIYIFLLTKKVILEETIEDAKHFLIGKMKNNEKIVKILHQLNKQGYFEDDINNKLPSN